MALDITVNDSHDKPEMSIPLFMEDYDSIMEKIENLDGFDIIKKSLADYYGESQVYINQLDDLRLEILSIKELFHDSFVKTLKFLSDFLNLIEYARNKRKTIKFIGD
jgi:hypothetical protein